MRPGVWTAAALVCALLVGGVPTTVSNDGGQDAIVVDQTDDVGDLVIENITTQTVEPGVTVTGLLGYIEGSQPGRLVVFTHGYGHNVEQSWAGHVARTVRADTAVVTTNYRDNLGFPILRGAQDTIQATLDALDRFPTVHTVYLLSVSMGSAVGGTAIVESRGLRNPGESLFDHWITVEGVSMPSETWAAAKIIGHPAADAIERDAGGTPLDDPDAYARRSPALRADEIAAGGLLNAVVIHAPHDGLVPYNQGREQAKALVAAEIDTEMITVTRDETGQTSGTTITKQVSDATGLPDPNEDVLDLTGHGSEADPDHPVIRMGFERLGQMLDGTHPGSTYAETVIDDQF